MFKCIAPLIFLASTIAPHAQTCPTFTGPENYLCDTYDSNQRLTSKPKFQLSIKAGTVAGMPSYRVESAKGGQSLVIGKAMESSLEGKTYVATASCGSIKGSKGMLDAIVLRTQVKDGPLVSETYFYPQGGGAVRLSFGGNGPNGGLTEKNVCRPVYPSRKAP